MIIQCMNGEKMRNSLKDWCNLKVGQKPRIGNDFWRKWENDKSYFTV